MRFHDGIIGGVLFALGLWIAVTASGFPRLTGQPIGPGTFPVLLGSLCALGGAAIALMSIRKSSALVQLHDGWKRPERQATVAIMVVGTAVLASTFEWIGFPLGGSLLLAALFLASGRRHPVWIAVATGFVFVVHLLLTRFLQVPLPAGRLEGLF